MQAVARDTDAVHRHLAALVVELSTRELQLPPCMAERILHPSYSLQVPKEWMIQAVSMKGELMELETAANAYKG